MSTEGKRSHGEIAPHKAKLVHEGNTKGAFTDSARPHLHPETALYRLLA